VRTLHTVKKNGKGRKKKRIKTIKDKKKENATPWAESQKKRKGQRE